MPVGHRIGQVAKRVGMTVEGLRYYEKRGLLRPAERSRSGYRLYGESEIDRLRFIKAAQEMGFSLGEIEELLELRDGSDRSCGAMRQHLEAKLERVRHRIELLQAMEQDLEDAVARCDEELRLRGGRRCPVLLELGARSLAAMQLRARGTDQ